MAQYITLLDFVLLPFIFLILYRVARFLRNRYLPKTNPLRPYFMPALLLKIAGAVAFAMVYNFYYGFGDTFHFYNMGTFFTNIFKHDLSNVFSVYLTGGDDFYIPKSNSAVNETNFDYLYNHQLATIVVGRFSSFLGLFCFNNFLLITIAFSIIAFSGIWKLFRMFSTMFPTLIKPIAYCTLFLPSAIFWSSGILKDSLTIGAIGWLTYSIWTVLVLKKNFISSAVIGLLTALLLLVLKSYILVCYIPAISIWIGSIFYKQIRNPNVKRLVWVGLIGVLIYLSTRAEEIINAQQRQIEELARAALLQNALLVGYDAGSSYNLGVSSGSAGSILTASPLAIATALYRPFLWEVKNPVMLFSALESLLFLVATIYVILRAGVFKFFRLTFTKGMLLFCLVFSLSFSLGVALSSNNFGTLVRYKIPAMPFYLILLLLVYHYSGKPLPTWLVAGKKKQSSPAVIRTGLA
jgi:hypothetical protein